MAKFTFFLSYYESLKELTTGDAFTVLCAICELAFNGNDGVDKDGEPLKGVPKSVYSAIRPNVIASLGLSAARAEAGSRGGSSSKKEAKGKQTQANDKQTEANGKQNEANAKQTPSKRQANASGVGVGVGEGDKKSNGTDQAELVRVSNLSDPLKGKLLEWLQYKRERREGYKEMGLKSLISETKRHETEAGTESVIALINESMSNGWKGIIWDRLKPIPRKERPRDYQQRGDYNMSELERLFVKN